MAFSVAAFTASFALIVVAEMGDKTQFIAMSFAAKYNPYKVLFAIFLATMANFAIMVAVGQLITTVLPMEVISLAASLSFIGFGLWTLKPEKAKEENPKPSRFGVVGTVAAAFFIAEFGDKTQLTTISLAAEYQSALAVLIGAVLGMLVADGAGIVVGVVLGKHIPEKTIKWISATIFIVFGLVGIYEVLPSKIGLTYTALALAFLLIFCILVTALLTLKRKPKTKRSQDLKPKNMQGPASTQGLG
ncbi:MAG: TMEM165/GDT1 family protein [Candidatus Bathyarchaeia archaeon]